MAPGNQILCILTVARTAELPRWALPTLLRVIRFAFLHHNELAIFTRSGTILSDFPPPEIPCHAVLAKTS